MNLEYKPLDKISVRKYLTLDLHGYTKEVVASLIDVFINDAKTLKEEEIVIVHGIGGGIIKQEVSNVLKKRKDIASFKLAINNLGATIVTLKND